MVGSSWPMPIVSTDIELDDARSHYDTFLRYQRHLWLSSISYTLSDDAASHLRIVTCPHSRVGVRSGSVILIACEKFHKRLASAPNGRGIA